MSRSSLNPSSIPSRIPSPSLHSWRHPRQWVTAAYCGGWSHNIHGPTHDGQLLSLTVPPLLRARCVSPPLVLHLSTYLSLPRLHSCRFQLAINLSSGLLDLNISQHSVCLLRKAVSSLSDGLGSQGREEEEEEEKVEKENSGNKDVTVYFTDDLRTGEFKYITDSSGKYHVIVTWQCCSVM